MKKLLLLILLMFFTSIAYACVTTPTNDSNQDTGPIPLTTNLTDELRLEREYEGYSFIEDGIGEVEFYACNTGHSTDFRELGGDETFRTRYLGIDTPAPYTNPPEAWSLAVTDFVCDTLESAVRIVLEADPDASRRDSTSRQRYLVYVWYDDGQGELRNLNLELIELAYARYTGASLYRDLLMDAWFEAQATNRRIWGEDDPDPRTAD